MASKSKDFFESGTSGQFEWVLGLYDQVLRLKAESKSSKPDNVIKLDKWYQNELPKKIKSRGKDLHLTHDEMVQTIKWKLARGKFRPNLVNLVQMNTPRVVMTDTKKAFRKLSKTNDVQAAANILCNMKGVSPGMASAVLAAGAPQLAPFMADECLLAMPDVDSVEYTMKEYMSFVEHIKACVERLNQQGGSWTPHTVELAVWTHYVANDLKPELLADIPSAAAAKAAATAPAAAVPTPQEAEDSQEKTGPAAAAAASAEGEASTPSPAADAAAVDAAATGTNGDPEDAKAAPAVAESEKTDPAAAAVSPDKPTSSPSSEQPKVNGQDNDKNGHGEAGAPAVAAAAAAAAPAPVNGTNGNGKHDHSEEDNCDEVAEAKSKSVSNGSSEKQENGTTKLSESVKTDEGNGQTEEASSNNSSSSVKRPSSATADDASATESSSASPPPSKKVRTEDSPAAAAPHQQPEQQQQQPESATVA